MDVAISQNVSEEQLARVTRISEQASLLYSTDQIEAAIDSVAAAISNDLADKNPIVLCVMQGGVVFTGQLLVRLSFPLQLDYIHVTRYQNSTHGGILHWEVKPVYSIKNRCVLIVDDILDKGVTLAEVIEHCESEGASSVHTAVLVNKEIDPGKQQNRINVDYFGLSVDDHYVFGYGMDYESYLRNVPGIYAVNEIGD